MYLVARLPVQKPKFFQETETFLKNGFMLRNRIESFNNHGPTVFWIKFVEILDLTNILYNTCIWWGEGVEQY